MAKHNETGLKGEQIAENFLLNLGYAILHRNWRFGHKEIDLIASKGDLLVFTEVKARKGIFFGFPEESVNIKKQGFMKMAAEAYIMENTHYNTIRFDVISILIDKGIVKEVTHFEGAFY